jgi:hypothetical protein
MTKKAVGYHETKYFPHGYITRKNSSPKTKKQSALPFNPKASYVSKKFRPARGSVRKITFGSPRKLRESIKTIETGQMGQGFTGHLPQSQNDNEGQTIKTDPRKNSIRSNGLPILIVKEGDQPHSGNSLGGQKNSA